MANEQEVPAPSQEVPPQEALPQDSPQSPATSILNTFIKQKEHDLIDLIKTRSVDYTFTGIYDEPFPKSCKIRRWSYGLSIQLLPETIGVIGEVIGLFASLSGKRTVDMEMDGVVDDIFVTIASSEKVGAYGVVLERIGRIVQKTLDGTNGQKIDVNELELADIIGIGKIILNQNLGVLLKNVKSAPTNAGPVKENSPS